jgi:hypothetical protein
MRWLVGFLVLASFGAVAHASKPIPWTMKGCVTGGVFYSVDGDSASIVKSMRKPLDISKLDGKHIEVAGLLYPGDYFTPGDAPPTVKGACTAADLRAIEYGKAHELRMQAGRLASEGKLDESLKLVEASIKLVQPANCDTFIDRAHLFARKKDLASAARDVEILRTRKCHFRGALNWLLLQELAAELRKHGADKTAVAALTLALASCNADICRPDLERDLAAAKQAVKK